MPYQVAEYRDDMQALARAGNIITSTALGAGASFTQATEDRFKTLPIGRIRGLAWANAAGTLYLEESENGSSWTTTTSVPVSASTTTELPWISLTKRYYRFKYTNGGSAQTSFVLIQQTGGLDQGSISLTGSNATEGIADMVLNTAGTLLASAARTTLAASDDQTNKNAKGIMVFINVSVASGTGGLSLDIQGKDPTSGAYHSILSASAALTATGTASYVVYPGASGTTVNIKQTAGLILPRTWRIVIFTGDASSYTYSVVYSYVI